MLNFMNNLQMLNFMKNLQILNFMKNLQMLNFMKIDQVGAELFHEERRTDGQT
jgi:hypothetical protein